MKCFSHTDRDATATCQGCGKGLCVECSGRFDTMTCEECLLSHNKQIAVEMYKGLAITVVIIIAGLWFAIANNLGGTNFSGYFFFALLPAFTYWGWRFISEHQLLSFFGTVKFWLLYFAIKLVVAYIIGIFVGPYQVFKKIKELRTAGKTKKQIASGDL